MMTVFLWISSLVFTFLFVIWGKSGFLNFSLKIIFLALGFLGYFLLLQQNGYIVNVKQEQVVTPEVCKNEVSGMFGKICKD